MNKIRTVISFLFLTVVTLSLLGWRWAGGLPSPKLESARAVLAIGALASIGALALIWAVNPRKSH